MTDDLRSALERLVGDARTYASSRALADLWPALQKADEALAVAQVPAQKERLELSFTDAATIIKALTIGRISWDGDGWFAADAGYDYYEAEQTLDAASAVLRSWRDGLPPEAGPEPKETS